MRCIQAFRFVLYLEEEHSDSHAEHVRSCPECGELLLGHAMGPQELTSQPMLRRTVGSRSPRSH